MSWNWKGVFVDDDEEKEDLVESGYGMGVAGGIGQSSAATTSTIDEDAALVGASLAAVRAVPVGSNPRRNTTTNNNNNNRDAIPTKYESSRSIPWKTRRTTSGVTTAAVSATSATTTVMLHDKFRATKFGNKHRNSSNSISSIHNNSITTAFSHESRGGFEWPRPLWKSARESWDPASHSSTSGRGNGDDDDISHRSFLPVEAELVEETTGSPTRCTSCTPNNSNASAAALEQQWRLAVQEDVEASVRRELKQNAVTASKVTHIQETIEDGEQAPPRRKLQEQYRNLSCRSKDSNNETVNMTRVGSGCSRNQRNSGIVVCILLAVVAVAILVVTLFVTVGPNINNTEAICSRNESSSTHQTHVPSPTLLPCTTTIPSTLAPTTRVPRTVEPTPMLSRTVEPTQKIPSTLEPTERLSRTVAPTQPMPSTVEPTQQLSTVVPERTVEPTQVPFSVEPTLAPRQAFTDPTELQVAVDAYLNPNDWDAAWIAQTYGYPIGTWNVSLISDFSSLFASTRNPLCVFFNEDIGDWDVSHAKSMDHMFDGAAAFQGDSLSQWDTSRVKSMAYMFQNAVHFHSNLNAWDVSKVTTMTGMFLHAHSFHSDLDQWKTSRVTDLQDMFRFAYSFHGNISTWDVSRVTTMRRMFGDSYSFNGDLSAWDTSSLTNTWSMFREARIFEGVGIGNWDMSRVTTTQTMFYNASAFDEDLSHWDVSKVTAMNRMFYRALNFRGDGLSLWNVSQVTGLSGMFYGASQFQTDLCPWISQLAGREVEVDDSMLVGTNCPDQSPPQEPDSATATSFCYLCSTR